MSDDPLRNLQLPEVPAGLREEALSAGRRAFAEPARPDIWTRLHASRPARLAWAATVAALAAANVFLPQSREARGPATASSPTRPDPEVAAVTRLPHLDEQSLPTIEGGRS